MIAHEIHGKIAVLRFEHGKVNAIDLELFTEFLKQLREVEESSSTSLVLTGTGKAFSAGVDLFRVLEGGMDYANRFVPALVEGLEKLFLFPKPVVAAVNGHAIAGGCLIACASDYRVATPEGNIGVPELLVGVPFPPLALEIMRFAVSHEHLPKIIYGGTYYPMAEAQKIGMIDEIVAQDQLLSRAYEVAEQLSKIPSRPFEFTKRQMRQPYIDSAQKFGESSSQIEELWASPQIHNVIRHYLDRTIGKKKGTST